MVTSKNVNDTGEDVLSKLRTTIKAKEDGICIDRVRKVKDRKVIVSCRNEEERRRVRNKIRTADEQLDVQDVKNQYPLVVLRNVLKYNKDEDVIQPQGHKTLGLLGSCS